MFDRFRAFSVRQQIAAVAFAVGLGALMLGLIWFFLLRTTYTALFTDLRPADAATIVANLDKKKIDYRLKEGGTTILVPSGIADSTRLGVMTEDLPLKGTVGFELFNKTDMGLTDFAQKINYQRALQGELERTIMTLDGIDEARVHLSLGEDRVFRDDRVPPKASVTVRMQRGQALPPNAAQGIQRLVAAAVPNLEPSDVVLLDEKGRLIGAPVHVDPVPGTGSPVMQERRAIEDYYASLVREALVRAYPQQDIAVSLVANGAVRADSVMPEWNPAARNFPLQVTLSAPASFDAASQEGLKGVVLSAVHSEPAKGDVVIFEVLVPPVQSVDSARVRPIHMAAIAATPAPLPDEDGAGEWIWPASIAAGLVILLVMLGIIVGRVRRPRRLTAEQRKEFVANLCAALGQAGGDRVGISP
ncbi:MAG TPA: flagellar basal-body MS-ring/collar protein FliF [Rhizomicrobium sp.]|jgi:flagellar M-ring protein FliF